MAVFVINTDITTDTPTIEVTVSPDKPLPLGRHRFRLIVVDDSGNKSAARRRGGHRRRPVCSDRSAQSAEGR